MNRQEKFGYVMGLMTILLPMAMLVALRLAFPGVVNNEGLTRLNQWVFRWGPGSKFGGSTLVHLRSVPDEQTIAALNDIGAIYDNTANLTDHGDGYPRGSFVTEPHAERRMVLRPNLLVGAYFLEPKHNVFDLPVLYVNLRVPHPASVAAYLQRETTLAYRFSTDARGYRTTLPVVEAPRRVLVVGDSVAFGVGVSDEHTIASQLQIKVGSGIQVVNAGVGDYRTADNMATVEAHKRQGFEHLVYVICTNDLDRRRENPNGYESEVTSVVMGLRPYLKHYAKITVLLQQYIEEIDPTMFPDEGATPEAVRLRNAQLASGRTFGATNGSDQNDITFINWYDIALRYRNAQQTVFGYFGLYADHAHFSPKGNALAAEAILTTVSIQGTR